MAKPTENQKSGSTPTPAATSKPRKPLDARRWQLAYWVTFVAAGTTREVNLAIAEKALRQAARALEDSAD